MCTLTYLPVGRRWLFASNRDEVPTRGPVLFPALHPTPNHGTFLFPQDAKGGGSWYAAGPTRALCLLNGGQTAYAPKPPYRRSRGLILLDVAIAGSLLALGTPAIPLEDIEPFTLVELHWQPGQLPHSIRQAAWGGDSHGLAIQDLSPALPHLWASAMLYTPEERHERHQRFARFLGAYSDAPAEIADFHIGLQSPLAPNLRLATPRHGRQTVSFTCLDAQPNGATLRYLDLVGHTDRSVPIPQGRF